MKYILSFDQGTTSSRAILFDEKFQIVGIEQKETDKIFPQSGWVEQDACKIYENQIFVARELIRKRGVDLKDIVSIGITNQRETTVVWNKNTGEPVYNAIIWQDKRTEAFCNDIKSKEIGKYITNTTGLVVDSYFSATKVKWILDNVEGVREDAEKGDLLFGTVDSWLVWNLTDGKVHITDVSNASRTMMYDIYNLQWDDRIVDFLGIPKSMLPKVVDSSAKHARTDAKIFGEEILIGGLAGDQQAALFGQTCFDVASVKNTYGTGCFMLMNTGDVAVKSNYGLVTTIAWSIDGKVSYALEGSVFVAGAAIQWLRDKLGIIKTAAETEGLATEIADTQGVYFVPAFVGLGAPYWNMSARGAIVGISGGTTKNHIVRAALEAMAYQTKEVLDAMEKDSGRKIKMLNVDGGAVANNFLMQFQSDILGIDVLRPMVIESTALGVAYMAALSVGMCTIDEIRKCHVIERRFESQMDKGAACELFAGWKNAVGMVL